MRLTLIILALGAVALPASAQTLTGTASIIDGDTLEIHGERIRLHGIDAVELDQTCTTREGHAWPCGRAAAQALRRFLEGRTVGCEVRGRDDHGRHVSICHAGKDDLSAWMAREGWALADRNAPRLLNYTSEERMARFLGKGIWSGSLEAPKDWRRQHQ